jgi:OmpA-OmpF porin, OOP family
LSLFYKLANSEIILFAVQTKLKTKMNTFKPIRWIAVICCIVLPYFLSAQISPDRILKRAKKKTEQKVERRIEKRIDKAVDKSLDEVEDSIDGKEKPQESQSPKQVENPAAESASQQTERKAEVLPAAQPQLTWSQFDFVPGDIIIFEDNLEDERNGEFPSKWDLVAGTIENASFGDDNVIFFRKATSRQGIVPLIKENQQDYLPDAFTVEFDAYFEASVYNQTYIVNFFDMKNQKRIMGDLRIYINKANYDKSEGVYPGSDRSHTDHIAKWRRVSISFNHRALKVYLDDARLLNIPNITDNPTGITLRGDNASANRESFIKNIRIAKGAVPLYDKFLTDGKIVTNGIRFDVNKATIRPESMGVINEIVKLMKDHPDLNFSVEGHTDSDGSADLNQRLSEARAKAVMDQMIEMGIAANRLTSTGHGQSNPMAPNNTPEGKAQNRRVEFVKI